ncbi:TIGR04540 family protein [Clostridium sp. CTA-5]
MRAVYKNPGELATCLKDLVDTYLEELISYDNFESKVSKIIKANGDSVYKNGHMPVKLANILGEERVEIINKIFEEMK